LKLEELVIKQQICKDMAHNLFSSSFFLRINPIEIPRIALSYTPKIKIRMRSVDFMN